MKKRWHYNLGHNELETSSLKMNSDWEEFATRSVSAKIAESAMRRRLSFSGLSIFVVALFCGATVTAQNFEVDESALAGIQLPVPEKNTEKEYLGLSEKGNFSLAKIKARMIMIEIFSMYCPICQREAPIVNQLQAAVEEDPILKKNLRLVGIGIGNTPFEVEVYRSKFNVLFPLFPDDSFQVQKVSQEKFRTPTFILALVSPGDTLKIFDIHVGPIKSSPEYLAKVKKYLENQ